MYIEKIQIKGRTLEEAILRYKEELGSKLLAVDKFPIKVVDGEKYINIGGEWSGMLDEVAVSATGIGKRFNEVRSALAGTGNVYQVIKDFRLHKIKGKRGLQLSELVVYEYVNKIIKSLNLLGFSSIAAYEKTISEFQNLVKKKAHRFVDNYFYIYEDSLAKEENKLADEIYVNQLYARLINSEASKYHEGNSISLEFNRTGSVQGEKRRLKQFKEREAKKEIGKEAIDSLGLFLTKSPKFDYDEFSKVTSKEEMVAVLKTEISNQYGYIQDSREYITAGDTVFEFSKIIQQVLKKEGIGAGSVLYTIVMDKINDVARNQILHGVAIAIFAIAVGLLTAGTGTVAILGATTVAAAGIYVTKEDIKKYQGNAALHAIGLTDKEPSIVWGIISIVGTALDAAALIKLVKLGRGLGKTVDAIDFEKQVLDMQELTGAMKANIIKQARLGKELKLAMNSLRGKAFMMAGGLDPQVFVAMRAAIKKGLVNFDQFLLELKTQKLIRSMEDLSPEQVKSLKDAFVKIKNRKGVKLLDESQLGKANKVQLVNELDETVGYITRNMQYGPKKGITYQFNATQKIGEIGKGGKYDLNCVIKLLDSESAKDYRLVVKPGEEILYADLNIPHKINEQYSGIGKIVFDDAHAVMKNSKKVPEIDGMFGAWVKNEDYYVHYGGESINLKKFWKAYDSGMSETEAAFETITGEWAKAHKYTKVEIQGKAERNEVIFKFLKE